MDLLWNEASGAWATALLAHGAGAAMDSPGMTGIAVRLADRGIRVASLVADDLLAEGRIRGLACLGYPFHPPDKPTRLRTAHLADLATPTLICQGTRDPFGTRDEVTGYDLSPAIQVRWFDDGDHDLRPRKSVSGFTAADHLDACADAVAEFARARAV